MASSIRSPRPAGRRGAWPRGRAGRSRRNSPPPAIRSRSSRSARRRRTSRSSGATARAGPGGSVAATASRSTRSGRRMAARLAYVEFDPTGYPWHHTRIVVADLASGALTTLVDWPGAANLAPRWSPDGQHLAFISDRSGWATLWLIGLDGGEARHLVDDHWEHEEPTWAPDGNSLVYTRNVDGNFHLMRVGRDGGAPQTLADGPGLHGAPAFSPDGARLLFTHQSPVAPPNIYAMPAAGGRADGAHPQHPRRARRGGAGPAAEHHLPEYRRPGDPRHALHPRADSAGETPAVGLHPRRADRADDLALGSDRPVLGSARLGRLRHELPREHRIRAGLHRRHARPLGRDRHGG